jgi:hypothetical protein
MRRKPKFKVGQRVALRWREGASWPTGKVFRIKTIRRSKAFADPVYFYSPSNRYPSFHEDALRPVMLLEAAVLEAG